jgi:predicted AAA+ superfamily ATPase
MTENTPYFIQMKRDFEKTLLSWKENSMRTPLIVRGARQVGKTYAIQQFGQAHFDQVISINFEASPEFHKCFETMNPQEILAQIELLSQKKIAPQKTLLFLDEIQNCPNAIQSLRYFKENRPDLHVIGAGSLLEFSLQNLSFPVGRVQFGRMFPLSFGEYLDGLGDQELRKSLEKCTLETPPSAAVHDFLLKKVRDFFAVGGMPNAVHAFIKTGSFLEVSYIQKALMDAFESDFGKYAKKSQHRHLKKIFQQAPQLIGSHIKYSRIDPELPNPAREIKQAIERLKLAGLIHPIRATSAGSAPLLSGLKETLFKLIFLDVGLLYQGMQTDPLHPGLMSGPLAEQFVGQELLASMDPFLPEELFFWNRPNGDAEVDYLIAQEGLIYPIEVKAGKTGKLKSLQIFLKEKKAPFGIKVSTAPLAFERNIMNIPFYLVNQIKRLIKK